MDHVDSFWRQYILNCNEGSGVNEWDCETDCTYYNSGKCTKQTNIPKRLKDIDFNLIDLNLVAIYQKGEVESGYTRDVVRKIGYLEDYKVVSTNIYFDTFVIRLDEID